MSSTHAAMKFSAPHALRQARGLARAGDNDAAEQAYRDILGRYPANRSALAELQALLASKIENPPQPALQAVVDLYRQRRLVEAQRHAALLLEDYPHGEILCHIAGSIEAGLGHYAGALALFDRAVALAPDYAEAHNGRGNALKDLGQMEAALAAYDTALRHMPGYAEAHLNRGIPLRHLGRTEDALESYDNALRLSKALPESWYNRANLLRDLSRHDEALASYDRAIALRPDYLDAHRRRADLLVALKRPTDAITSYLAAIQLAPSDAALYRQCGSILLLDLKQPVEALGCYDRALALDDQSADSHFNRGNALLDLDRTDEANAAHDRAILLRQGAAPPLANMLHRVAHACHWSPAAREAEHALAARENEAIPPFFMLPIADDPHRQLGWARQWSTRPGLPDVAAAIAPLAPPADGRIRLGYFSADFHNHATMLLMAGLFEQHDRTRFEVHCFSYGAEVSDMMRTRLTDAVEHFHAVGHLPDAAIAARARAAGIDIAVDLKGHTEHGRMGIFAQRAAPHQVAWLGYPGSSGAPFIDHIIADPIVIPASDRQYYSENILYLPHCYQVNDDRRAIPTSDAAPSRADCGLPETGFVFCSFNDNYKISPDVFDIWMRLLAQVDGSVLWLLAGNGWAPVRLRREAAARGIDPARLIFAPRLQPAEHLARHLHADLFLDTFNVNAHTTASDALWAGVPLVTRMGRSFAARVAGSLLHAVGLPELATENADAYEALALALARDPARLAEMKARLVAGRTAAPLFDTAGFTRDIEALYSGILADAAA